MTQSSSGSIPPASPKKSGVPVFVWILGGCGCLGIGGFFFLMLLAIALPSFLNQVGKARGSEAKSTLGTINRAQQAYQLEKGVFAKSIKDLDARVSGKFFNYKVVPSSNPKVAIATATSTQPELKSYTGFIFAKDPAKSEVVLGVCETNIASSNPPELSPITGSVTEPECPPGSSLVP
jgi:type IV pilus assembly protein PilA